MPSGLVLGGADAFCGKVGRGWESLSFTKIFVPNILFGVIAQLMCATRRASKKGDSLHRYSDYVKIDESQVPEKFRHLIPFARYWSIGDDVDRVNLMKRTSRARKKALVDAVRPLWAELSEWCDESHGFATPVPEEVVIFEMLFEAVAEAEYDVYPPPPPPPRQPDLPTPTLTAEERAELENYVDQLKRPATGDHEQDFARVRETMKRIETFWIKVLTERSPGLSRERIEEYLGVASTPKGPQDQFPGVSEYVAKTLQELRTRVDTMLAECEGRKSTHSLAGPQTPDAEPGAAPNAAEPRR